MRHIVPLSYRRRRYFMRSASFAFIPQRSCGIYIHRLRRCNSLSEATSYRCISSGTSNGRSHNKLAFPGKNHTLYVSHCTLMANTLQKRQYRCYGSGNQSLRSMKYLLSQVCKYRCEQRYESAAIAVHEIHASGMYEIPHASA